MRDGYKKEVIQDGNEWIGRFIRLANENKSTDTILYEVRRPMKSTAASMVGTFIQKFDFDRDLLIQKPHRKDKSKSKLYTSKNQTIKSDHSFQTMLSKFNGISCQTINDFTIYIAPTQWASLFILYYKDTNYNIVFDLDTKEIMISNTPNSDNSIEDVIQFLLQWDKQEQILKQISDRLFTEDDTIVNPDKKDKYKTKACIWNFYTYEVYCSKEL